VNQPRAQRPIQRVLLISGSTRSASTNSALCRTAPLCAPDGVIAQDFEDLAGLPHFNPDDDRDPLPPAVAHLRASVAAADAVLFCTPEYAGTLPGSFKNLLDWTVGGTEFNGKPVAWIKAAADPHRGEGAHATLATVLAYIQANVVEAACRHIPVARETIGADGLIADPDTRTLITEALATLADAAAAQAAG
jgi:chromate reductase, NAD(P)H dehydrogenase (quinone)